MNMTNKLILPVESRMQGDLHVRFGGRLWETYHRKVARRPSPSLQATSGIFNAGSFKQAFRMYPKNAFLPHRQDFCYVRWF